MKWVKKQKQSYIANDRLAGRMANAIIRMQRAFASFMNRITKDRSPLTLKGFLFLFLLTGSLYSAYIIYSSFEKRKANSIQFGRLNTPIYLGGTQPANGIVTKSEYQQLQDFDHYLDSLQKSGSRTYDSILKFRPGLLDSVKQLKSFYNNQFQNQK